VLDCVLSGGRILNGSGEPEFSTDVAIHGDRIARIGSCADLDARARIDCANLVIAPGFIDMHGHSDELLFVNPTAESKVRQGVTTEIGGNCGSSPGPLSDQEYADRRARLHERYGFDLGWRDLDGFFSALERSGTALNFCCLVGLGNTRDAVGGVDARPLTREALARECRLVAEACEQGAIGVSSGLIYPPGRFADANELTSLARAAATAGSPLYATHLRSEGDDLLDALDEALEIGRHAGVGVQLSHHKASGKKNWGKVQFSLERVERARAGGLDVALDQYPYKASSTGLDAILPSDVNVGSRAEVVARLDDPVYAALTAARLELEWGGRWNEVYVSTVSSTRNKPAEGKSMEEIAREAGRTPAAAAVRLLAEERLDVSAIFFTMCEADVQTVLSHDRTCIGSDASARSSSGPTSAGKPHPRAYGTFPRIFKRYVRDLRLLTLAEAVRRATWLPASRLGLRRRGRIAEDWYADLVAFDPARIADTSTYADPHRYPIGVRHVFVNGIPVVRDERTTGNLPGKALRRGRDL